MRVRQRRPREERDRSNFPRSASDETLSRVFTMLEIFQGSSAQYLRLLIQARVNQLSSLRETSIIWENEDAIQEVANTKSLSEIQELLLRSTSSAVCEVPLHLIPDQIAMICTQKNTCFGSKICFAVYIKSLPLLAEFLMAQESAQTRRNDKSLANRAIEFLLNSPLPPMFYPNMDSCVLMSVDLEEVKPVTTTAIGVTQSTMYVGCAGPVIKAISIQRTQRMRMVDIEIPDMANEPYSLVVHKGILIVSSVSEPALQVSPREKSVTRLPVSYSGNVFMMVHKFAPPVVTDGQLLYSIGYNELRVKTFKLEGEEIVFLSVVKLSASKDALRPPFTELLPASQRNTCSIATNGVYISFLFQTEDTTICRIFLLRNGVHQHDVVLSSFGPIDGWCFDGFRPAHCVLKQGKGLFIDSRYTLPKWLIGFEEPPDNPKVRFGKPNEIVSAVSEALAVFAARIVGSAVHLPLALNDPYYKGSIEKCILKFLEQNNTYAVQAFLVILETRMRQDSDNVCSTDLFRKLYECYDDKNYEYLHNQIVFTFLSALDIFACVDQQLSSEMLLKIIQSNCHMNLLCKYLPRVQHLEQALSKKSVKALCNATLKTTFVYDEEAIALLKELQYILITKGGSRTAQLLVVYAIELYYHFEDDHRKMMEGKWTPQEFVNSVSFTVFRGLVQLACATGENLPLNSELGSCFFRASILEKPVESPESAFIEKFFMEAFFVSMLVFIHLIRNDHQFYHLGAKSHRRMSDIHGIRRGVITEANIDAVGVSQALMQTVIETANDCCCENVDDEEIIECIHSIFYLIAKGDRAESDVIAKCNAIKRIQPQLFRDVFSFLGGTDPLSVVEEPSKCYAVKFMRLFEHKFTEEMNVILGFFLEDLDQIKEHFVVLPNEFLCRWFHSFDLRFYMPTCVVPSTLHFEMVVVTSLNLAILQQCTDNVLTLANRISDSETMQMDLSWYDINMMPRESLLKMVIMVRVALACQSASVFPCDSFFLQCIQLGDYEVAYHAVEALKAIIARQHYSIDNILQFIFNCIGGFLSAEKNIFVNQRNNIESYRIVMMLACFMRTFERSNDARLKKIMENVYTQADYLAMFAILNTKIDAIRPHVHVSFDDPNGKRVEGIVICVSETGFEVTSHAHFKYTEVKNLAVVSAPLGQEFITDMAHLIKQALCEFSEINVFKYACLCDVFEIPTVLNLFSYSEVTSLCSEFAESDESMGSLLVTFSSTWSIRYLQMPLFSFDRSDLICHETNLIEADLFGVNKVQKEYDILYASEKAESFTSTTVNPHSSTELCLQNHVPDHPFFLVVYAICSECAFSSSKIEIRKECVVKTCPQNLTVEIICDGVSKSFALSPRCDLVYYSIELTKCSILEYTFTTPSSYEPVESFGDGLLLSVDILPKAVPFRMSAQWRDTYIQELHCRISKKFMVSIFMKYIMQVMTDVQWYGMDLAYLLLDVLLALDGNVFTSSVRLADLETCHKTEEYEFVRRFTSLVKQHEEDRSRLVRTLCKCVSENIVTTITPRNTSAIHLDSLADDVLVGCYYISSTYCSREKPDDDTGPIYLVPADQISGTCLSCARDIRHTITLLLELAVSYEEFHSLMTQVKTAVAKVKAAEYLTELVDQLLPKQRNPTENERQLSELLPDFYQRNHVTVDSTPVMLMLLRSSFHAFPLSSWLLSVPESPSFAAPLVAGQLIGNTPKAPFIVRVCSPHPDCEFEFSDKSSFEDVFACVKSNSTLLSSKDSLFVRTKNPELGSLSDAKFYLKEFSPMTLEPIITNEVFKWRLQHSNQLMLAFIHGNRQKPLLREQWEFMPLASDFSFETVSMFASVLDNATSYFLRDHTMYYSHDELFPDEARLGVFHALFPEFFNASLLELLFEDSLTDIEKAGVFALAFQKGMEIPFHISSSFCKSIADCQSHASTRSVFLAVTGLPPETRFSALYIRSHATIAPITKDDIASIIIWSNVDPLTQSFLLFALDRMSPFARSVLLECVTKRISICALQHSSRPALSVVGGAAPGTLEVHPNAQVLLVGAFEDRTAFTTSLMRLLQSFLDTNYC